MARRRKTTTTLASLIIALLVTIFFSDNISSQVGPNQNSASQSQIEQATTTMYHPVIKVVDGDTLHVNINGEKQIVRLIGINTPETVDPRRPVECFGVEASNKAKELLTGKKVKLETDESQGTYDKYDRLLAYIYLDDGTFYNKYMVQEGYAYEYTYDLPYKYQAEFKQAQIEAKNAQRGLWSPTTCQNIS